MCFGNCTLLDGLNIVLTFYSLYQVCTFSVCMHVELKCAQIAPIKAVMQLLQGKTSFRNKARMKARKKTTLYHITMTEKKDKSTTLHPLHFQSYGHCSVPSLLAFFILALLLHFIQAHSTCMNFSEAFSCYGLKTVPHSHAYASWLLTQ